MIVIQGDPGTGKTVAAIYLIKLLVDIQTFATLEDLTAPRGSLLSSPTPTGGCSRVSVSAWSCHRSRCDLPSKLSSRNRPDSSPLSDNSKASIMHARLHTDHKSISK
jgi:hypothetical protein